MAKGLSPTQRTLKALRDEGVISGIVERFNQHAGPHGVRQDLFGIFDIVSIYPDRIVGVQCCGIGTHAAHRTKIVENEVAPAWIRAGGRIELWSWSKVKLKRGGKAMRWKPRVEVITLEMCLGEEE